MTTTIPEKSANCTRSSAREHNRRRLRERQRRVKFISMPWARRLPDPTDELMVDAPNDTAQQRPLPE